MSGKRKQGAVAPSTSVLPGPTAAPVQPVDDNSFLLAQMQRAQAPAEPNLLQRIGGTVDRTLDGVGRELTEWHFEGREARNGSPPARDELEAPGSSWKQLPPSMSIYHDNRTGKPERKYVHPDGREAVLDGDTGRPVTDPRYMPTFNYVNPMAASEMDGVEDVVEFTRRNTGHLLLDVLPYLRFGNVRRES